MLANFNVLATLQTRKTSTWKRRFGWRTPAAAVTAACLAVACRTNHSGRTAARGRGELAVARAVLAGGARSDKVELEQGCGPRGGAHDRWLQRGPYLQQVTPRSALVVWTEAAQPRHAPMEEAVVEVWPATARAGQRPRRRIAATPPSTAGELPDEPRYARLDHLTPSTGYCYRLLAGRGRIEGPFGFRTAPSAALDASVSQAVHVLVLGDSGGGGGDQRAVRAAMERTRGRYHFDLMVHLGDLAYERGRPIELEDRFFTPYRDWLAHMPVFPVAGNHEHLTADAAPFRQAFMLPDNGGRDGAERWYSFDWGPAHFAALDTEHLDGPLGIAQARWLAEDLSAHPNQWLVVYGHRPAYSSGVHGSTAALQQRFAPIFERYDVALVLAGHDHDYERSVPLRGGRPEHRHGVTYVVSGGGGRGTTSVGRSEVTVHSEEVLHFVELVVERRRLRAVAVDASGKPFDSFELSRSTGL